MVKKIDDEREVCIGELTFEERMFYTLFNLILVVKHRNKEMSESIESMRFNFEELLKKRFDVDEWLCVDVREDFKVVKYFDVKTRTRVVDV